MLFRSTAISSRPPGLAQPNAVAHSPSPAGTIKKVAVDAAFWLRYGLFSYLGHVLGFVVAMVVTVAFAVSTYDNPDNLSSAQTASLLQLDRKSTRLNSSH